MKLQILCENRASNPACMAEHGLSVLIEEGGRRILFDAGASDLFLHNAEKLQASLENVDTVVISHGHYDHTGGVPSFCGKNDQARIYIHENAFSLTFGIEDGEIEKEPCGIRWTDEEKESVKGRLILTRGITWLDEDAVISGTIPKPSGYSPTETFYKKTKDGELIPDPMDHEQFLAIRLRDERQESRGIFIFSGCSHNGVLPCLTYARTIFPGEKILGILAGMHLYHADQELRATILNQVAAEDIAYLVPVHCTGIRAISDLLQLAGERCIPAGTGDTIYI